MDASDKTGAYISGLCLFSAQYSHEPLALSRAGGEGWGDRRKHRSPATSGAWNHLCRGGCEQLGTEESGQRPWQGRC